MEIELSGIDDVTTAADIMSTDLVTILDGTTVEETVKLLVNKRITGAPVVDRLGRLVGVVSEIDVITQMVKTAKLSEDIFKEPVKYTKSVRSLPVSAMLDEIAREFIDQKIRRVPILDEDGKLVGIITHRDLMKLYYYRVRLS